MRKSIFHTFILLVFLSLFPLFSETVIVLNRTGFDIMEIRIQGDEQLEMSDNLIHYDVLLDSGYWEMEWNSPEGFTIELIDEMGDRYLKRLENPLQFPKLVITLEDLKILGTSESILSVRISNQLGIPVSELYLSSSGTDRWGEDRLAGRILHQDETIELDLSRGGEYDIRFRVQSTGSLSEYRIDGVTLRDRGLFVLEME